jgi:hypothetical protein
VLVAVDDGDPFVALAAADAAKSRIRSAQLLVLPAAGQPAYRERWDLPLPALEAFLAGR